MSNFSRIQLSGPKNQAKRLFEQFIGHFPSLRFMAWAMVEAVVQDGEDLTKLLKAAIEAGSCGQWYARFEVISGEDTPTKIKLIPYVGDRTITVWYEHYGKWCVDVDYRARPTATHHYSTIGKWENEFPIKDVVNGIWEVFGAVADWQRLQEEPEFEKMMDFTNAGFEPVVVGSQVSFDLGDSLKTPEGAIYSSARFELAPRFEEEEEHVPNEEEEDDDAEVEKYFGASTLAKLHSTVKWDDDEPTLQFAVLEQCDGCVFNFANSLTHRGFAKTDFSTKESALAWADENKLQLEFENGAGGTTVETHYLVVKTIDGENWELA